MGISLGDGFPTGGWASYGVGGDWEGGSRLGAVYMGICICGGTDVEILSPGMGASFLAIGIAFPFMGIFILWFTGSS